ncbi:ester cyclase [Fibrella sp. HMF5335]|uniref:Ester cyclase n=1 Tax=Fibrella rubiginis TaxID=2817060 RepID=A0A939K6Q2_9BACT|nr:ester cyclase [Fibrella rubiginis]MBO0939083.1 ester cyclase [Fibrella rubiginis]
MATIFQVLTFRLIAVVLGYFLYLPTFGQDATLPNANKKTIATYFDEGINPQKMNRIREFFASDYIWHRMNGTDVRSSQDSSHISMLRFLYKAIPDIHYTIDNVVAEGDMVAVNSSVTGTAKSEMFGFPAAEKKVRFKQMFFFRFANDKITEEWEVVDVDGLKAQLGKR